MDYKMVLRGASGGLPPIKMEWGGFSHAQEGGGHNKSVS